MSLGVKTTSHNKMLFHFGATVGGPCSGIRITKLLQDLDKENKTISETLKNSENCALYYEKNTKREITKIKII